MHLTRTVASFVLVTLVWLLAVAWGAAPAIAGDFHNYDPVSTTYDSHASLTRQATENHDGFSGAGGPVVEVTGPLHGFPAELLAPEAARAATGLSRVGNQNVRVLRNWANSKGWVQRAGDGPEIWGVRNADGSFSWRLKIKPEASMRPGLEADSKVPRFDARLGPGEYVNPFTGELGGRSVGTHIPLEHQWIP